MIILLKKNASQAQIANLTDRLKEFGVQTNLSVGSAHTIIGLVGDTSRVDIDMLSALEIVDSVQRVQDPFKKANRRFHEEDTVIELSNGIKIGGGNFQMIAGPCSVESERQIIEIAKAVKDAGATILRGGAFKPRTSPYAFQGLGAEGLRLLQLAKKETGLPIITELMDASHIHLFEDADVDIYDTRDFSISRPYASFNPSLDGMTFLVKLFDSDGEYLEAYNIFVCDDVIYVSAEDGAFDYVIGRPS